MHSIVEFMMQNKLGFAELNCLLDLFLYIFFLSNTLNKRNFFRVFKMFARDHQTFYQGVVAGYDF